MDYRATRATVDVVKTPLCMSSDKLLRNFYQIRQVVVAHNTKTFSLATVACHKVTNCRSIFKSAAMASTVVNSAVRMIIRTLYESFTCCVSLVQVLYMSYNLVKDWAEFVKLVCAVR